MAGGYLEFRVAKTSIISVSHSYKNQVNFRKKARGISTDYNH